MNSEWLNLLFGNPIGLLSIISVALTLFIGVFIIVMFVVRSGEKPEQTDDSVDHQGHSKAS